MECLLAQKKKLIDCYVNGMINIHLSQTPPIQWDENEIAGLFYFILI